MAFLKCGRVWEGNTETRVTLPHVSVIIIGRNEARNLPACIQSIREMDYPQDRLELMYVDTDSTDGSPDVARSLGVTVYEEHSDLPSAGRARNRGWREAQYEIVHFVDGDMTVAPGYLKQAVRHLGNDGVVCVIGRLDEKRQHSNPIAATLHYTWRARQPGFVDAPGAGGTFLKSALDEIEGYNSNILRGEETDLGFRLRAAGYRMLMIEAVMGTHDYDIQTLGQLVKWLLRMGYSFGAVLGTPPQASLANDRARARNLLVQAVLLVIYLGLALAMRWWWMLPLWPLALVLFVIVRYWNLDVPQRRWAAIRYYGLVYLAKPIIIAGIVQYWWQRIVRKV